MHYLRGLNKSVPLVVACRDLGPSKELFNNFKIVTCTALIKIVTLLCHQQPKTHPWLEECTVRRTGSYLRLNNIDKVINTLCHCVIR